MALRSQFGTLRFEDPATPKTVPKQDPPSLHFLNPKATLLNPYKEWCSFMQEEWDALPVALTRTWSPNLGKPEWEPYAAYEFLLLIGEDQWERFNADKITKEMLQFGAVWKDLWTDVHFDRTPFDHNIIGKSRYLLVRMPFGLRKNRVVTQQCHAWFTKRSYNPSKILPRVSYQGLLLRMDTEGLLAVHDAASKAVGVRGKVALPTITERIQSAPANGVLDLHRTVDENAAKEIGEALQNRVNTRLREIRFHGKSEMGVVGAHAIASALRLNDYLIKLDLTHASLGDDAALTIARCLSTNYHLQVLTLFDNRISDSGAARLAELLKFNQALQQFSLGGNLIGDPGALCIANALVCNGTLTKLKLDYNQITDAGFAAISQALSVNGAQVDIALLAQCHSDSAHEFTEVGALLELNLAANKCTDSGAISLANALRLNVRLQTLVLNDNRICDSGAAALGRSLFETNRSLTSLNLAQNNISDMGASPISNVLNCPDTPLKELFLSVNKIRDIGVAPLSRALMFNKTLMHLDLGYNQITDIGVTGIARALHHNHVLRVLQLGDNRIRDKGAIEIAEMLKTNTTLQVLNLAENDYIGAPGAVALASSLAHNTTLHTLNMNDNLLFGDDGAVAFAQMLHTNKTLTFATLDQNKIGDVGAIALCEALKVNSTMKRLFLTGNRIGYDGKYCMSKMLQFDRPQLIVDLARNDADPGLTPFPSKPLNSGVPK